MSERWRPIPGFPAYEASDNGRIRSVDRTDSRGRWLTGRVLRASDNGRGYLVVIVRNGGRSFTRTVHALVTLAFLGPRPEGLETRHLNGDPHDNRLVNLAYGTRSENHRDQVAHGTHREASKTHCPQGHEYSPANTYHRPGGGRRCRKCQTSATAAWRRNKRGATNG